MTAQIFSFDCFIDSRDGDASEIADSAFFRIYYVKLLFFALLPFLIATVSFGSWRLYARISKNSESIIGRATSTMVILLFLVHPNIVQYMFNTFNCFDVDGEARVITDLQILCYDGPHTFWALLVAFPSIVVWGLGIPFFAYILLTREKHRLKKIEVKEKYGFLYNGYRRQFYYWEVIIMYRKIVIVFIAVFVVNFGVIS